MNETPERIGFWEELKRRHVVRVATVYVVVSWLVLQVADVTFANFGIPAWAFRFVAIVLALGFPLSMVLAWALEMTPQGIRRTPSVTDAGQPGESTPGHAARRKRFSALFAAAVPTVLFGALALVFYLQRDTTGAPESSDSSTKKIIAVLPLVNMSPVAENAFFTGGLHEDILTQLSHTENLRVVSRTSVMPYFDTDKSLRVIGEELGADYVLEGSVRRIGDHVRVSVQLIEAGNDHHVWASNYDREVRDEFATQSAVARDISLAIQRELLPGSVDSLEGLPTRNVKAYDLYTQAQNISRTEIESESALTRQRNLLEAAVTEDPDFVEAWGMLNEVLDHSIRNVNQNGWFVPQGANPGEVLASLQAESKRALDKAVSLDPDNLQTLLALASDSVAEARAEFRAKRKKTIDRIVTEFPDSATGWYVLGWWYNLEGEFEAAEPAFLKAIELEPFHAQIVAGTLTHFRIAGNQELVTMLFDRIAQISPTTGEQTQYSEATNRIRLFNLLTAFWAEADPQMLERYGELLFSEETKFFSHIDEIHFKAIYWELRNEPDKLLALEGRLGLGETPDFLEVFEFNDIISTVAKVYQQLGEKETAQSLARQVLATQPLPQANHPETMSRNHAMFAMACAITEDSDCARRWADKLIEERGEAYNQNGLPGYAALAETDLDAAVRMILDEKARQPRWFGTDIIAANHLTFRELLLHPELMAYYRDDGKWIDYLAERVPEYAALRQQVKSVDS